MFRKKSKQYRNSRYEEQPPPLGLRGQGRTLPELQSESCCRAWSTGWQRECYDVDWQNLLGGHPLGRQAKLSAGRCLTIGTTTKPPQGIIWEGCWPLCVTGARRWRSYLHKTRWRRSLELCRSLACTARERSTLQDLRRSRPGLPPERSLQHSAFH